MEAKRLYSLAQIKAYNLIKSKIWSCVMDPGNRNQASEQKVVELILLRDLMKEV